MRLLSVLAIMLVLVTAVLSVTALAVPRLILCQGRLTDTSGNPLPDGYKSVWFIIWNDSAASAPANEIWNSGPLKVTITGGLFSVLLGEMPQPALTPALFTDTSRWLGITVGADQEITPRMRLVSVPYAMSAENAENARNAENALVARAVMDVHLSISGDTTDGATLSMDNAAGTNTIMLDADLVGDGAVDLPEGSISAAEIWNEPGIVAGDDNSIVNLNSDAMQDLATVTITTPASGYIVVLAKVNGSLSGTRSANYGYVQIDETLGGNTTAPYYAAFGMDSALSTSSYSIPAYVQRTYFKPAGTYTFRVEGMSYVANGVGAVTRCIYPMVIATYYPTSYGTVNTMVSSAERGQFDGATPQSSSVSGPEGPGGSQTLYRVDLRELELKAAKAQAEAERAQREVTEARLKQEMEQNRR